LLSRLFSALKAGAEKAKHQRKWISWQAGKQAAADDREEETGYGDCQCSLRR
jgi:hypothetical protein